VYSYIKLQNFWLRTGLVRQFQRDARLVTGLTDRCRCRHFKAPLYGNVNLVPGTTEVQLTSKTLPLKTRVGFNFYQ